MQEFADYITNLNWTFLFDILAMGGLIALVVLFFKKRNNLRLAITLCVFIVVYFLVGLISALTAHFSLYITKKILDLAVLVFVVVIVVVYQSDFKAILTKMGRRTDKSKHFRIYSSDEELRFAAGEIVKACQNLSKNDLGALIVIAPTVVPRHILETGTAIDAEVSSGLLESIFNTKAPLHDGAVVVQNNRILSAGCFLPLSENVSISKDLGTRHRAAIGITEESDVLAIVVSEETGIISVVKNGRMKRYMTPEKLTEEIETVFNINYFAREDNVHF